MKEQCWEFDQKAFKEIADRLCNEKTGWKILKVVSLLLGIVGVLSLVVSAVRQLVVLLPVGFLLSRTGQLDLVWLAFPVAELFSLALCIFFLRRVYLHEIKPLYSPGA